jgi:DNA invertase Pin-like site-specific DNA recombinase
VAYSYVRFSHPDQAKGDSLRRQTEAAAAWCQEHKVHLDTSRTLHDLGKSAYHRQNPDRYALARFLELVKEDKIARGSHLIVENLDRLTREHILPALTLVLNMIEQGIRIVQLKPVEMVYDETANPMQVMMMIMELSRGNSESEMKSQRVGEAWQNKHDDCQENGKFVTHNLPAWLEAVDVVRDHRGRSVSGTLRQIPAKVKAVQRIYELSAEGYGAPRIVKLLIAEGIPPLKGVGKADGGKGKGGGKWMRGYVTLLLHDRRVLGEYQPRGHDKPISGYYKAIITEKQWLASRAGIDSRRRPGAPRGQTSYDKEAKDGKHGFANPFSGLLRDAVNDGSYYNVALVLPSHGRGVRHRVLRNLSVQGRAPWVGFPFEAFEQAILKCLEEIDPAEIIPGAEKPEELEAITRDKVKVLTRIEAIKADLADIDKDYDPNLRDVLRQLEARQRQLSEKEQEAKQRQALPLEESWERTKDLLRARDTMIATEAEGEQEGLNDFRRHLRSVLRREIDGIWLVIAARGAVRLCQAQMWFQGGTYHHYLLLLRPASANGKARRPARLYVDSVKLDRLYRTAPALAAEMEATGLFPPRDLRQPKEANKARAELEALPPALIDRLLAEDGEDLA